MIEPRYYTVQQLAELLSLNPETIRREAARGQLRPMRFGRDLRFAESAVREWLASKEAAA
jgi:excisionase family DNA binding protein